MICAELESPAPMFFQLTPAERVVVHYLNRGLTNREIAGILGKSASTVKNQVSSCLHKLGAPSRVKLMVLLK